jgi:hypothetical protein
MSRLDYNRTNRGYLYHLIVEGKRNHQWINKTSTNIWCTPEELAQRAKADPNFDIN